MSAEHTLLAGIASVLTAAGSIAKVTGGPRLLLAKLGWDLPPGVDDIGLAGLNMERVGTRLTAWATLEADPELIHRQPSGRPGGARRGRGRVARRSG